MDRRHLPFWELIRDAFALSNSTEAHNAEGTAQGLEGESILLTVAIRTLPINRERRLQWRPAVAARESLLNAVEAMGEFADSVLALLLYGPVMAGWVLLVFVVLKVGWWTLLRVGRLFFPALPVWRRRTEEVQVG